MDFSRECYDALHTRVLALIEEGERRRREDRCRYVGGRCVHWLNALLLGEEAEEERGRRRSSVGERRMSGRMAAVVEEEKEEGSTSGTSNAGMEKQRVVGLTHRRPGGILDKTAVVGE